MREPQHPVKPAFDKAADEREAWRQQEIAKLNDEQRAQYQAMLDRQQNDLEEKTKALDEGRKDSVAESMRKQLSPLGKPQLQISGPYNTAHLHDLKRARDSVDDHLKGNETPETQRYGTLLHDAQAKAEKQVDFEHKQTLQNQELKQQMDRDRFLNQAGTAREFEENARDITQRKATERFNDAAREKSLQDAIEKAAEQEAARDLEQEHDLDHDPDHQR